MSEEIDCRNITEKEYDKLKDMEIIDHNTANLQRLINDLINKTGIIQSIRLKFKKELTPSILKIVSNHEQLLLSKHIKWELNFNENNIELIMEQK